MMNPVSDTPTRRVTRPVGGCSGADAPRPFVSVVTPFYNTAPYLAECIESVLAQTYANFEYVLLDNCSTDGSSDIAASYAAQDRRIRLIRCSEFVTQTHNYNRALRNISPTSEYCKIVQADDAIFPECLEQMVQAFEQNPSIGLVSSYWLEEDRIWGSGFPRRATILSGRECGALFFRAGSAEWMSLLPGINRTPPGFFGSQTQVMYRSSLVRSQPEFFDLSFQFPDLKKALDILRDWDFGFSHQVLSFTRRQSVSFLKSLNSVAPFWSMLHYIIAKQYAPVFLEAGEAASVIRGYKRQYYCELAEAALRLKGRRFWRYHIAMVKSLDACEAHDWPFLALQLALLLLWLASNPGRTLSHVVRYCKRRLGAKGLLEVSVRNLSRE
jgi:glycosyltransferase involved in cell wall biosynthesis